MPTKHSGDEEKEASTSAAAIQAKLTVLLEEVKTISKAMEKKAENLRKESA